MGQYNHTIDAKGRLIVPAKYRESLSDTFVITQGLDGCLYAYDNAEWARVEERLSQLPMIQKPARALLRHLLSGAAEVEIDKQGRVLIPTHLREYAKIDKDVVLVGAAKKLEIWSKEQWIEMEAATDIDQMQEQMIEYGIIL